MGFNCLKASSPLLGDSLIFTSMVPGVPCTHLIDLGWKDERLSTLKPASGFKPRTLDQESSTLIAMLAVTLKMSVSIDKNFKRSIIL